MYAEVEWEGHGCPFCGGALRLHLLENPFGKYDLAVTYYECRCDKCLEQMFIRTKTGETADGEYMVYKSLEVHVQSLYEYYDCKTMYDVESMCDYPLIPKRWEELVWENRRLNLHKKQGKHHAKKSKTSSKSN